MVDINKCTMDIKIEKNEDGTYCLYFLSPQFDITAYVNKQDLLNLKEQIDAKLEGD